MEIKPPVIGVRTTVLNPDLVRAAPMRLLFIGNSHTFGNDSLPAILSRLCSGMAAEMVTIGGATLRRHWQEGPARPVLRDERFRWTDVVTQDNGWQATNEPDAAYEYAVRFAEEIRALGARPLWYMTHPYHRIALEERQVYPTVTSERMFERNRRMAERLAREAGLGVAPVGEAWWRHMLATPEQAESAALYKADGYHAAPAGSFLSACVIGETLGGCDPARVAAEPGLPEAPALHALARAVVTGAQA